MLGGFSICMFSSKVKSDLSGRRFNSCSLAEHGTPSVGEGQCVMLKFMPFYLKEKGKNLKFQYGRGGVGGCDVGVMRPHQDGYGLVPL